MALLLSLLVVGSGSPAAAAVTAGATITVGTGSIQVAGVDRSRGADELIVYTRSYGKTTATDRWGAEAVVVAGVVTGFRDRQVQNGRALAIPRDGVVLSGHGAARVFLLDHARVGVRVDLAPSASSGGLPADAVRVGSATTPVSGVDRTRGSDGLILFTPARGTTTGTNRWGAEVAVVDGAVTSFVDRQVSGGPALAIPRVGVVLSGQGAARLFLVTNAQVGLSGAT